MSKIDPSEWGEALRSERERAGISRGDLARRCGVRPAEVERWEAGRSVPTGSARPRLRGSLPRLASPPRPEDLPVADAPPRPVSAREPERPRARTFGQALRAARERAEIDQAAAAELLEVTQTSWSAWERDQNNPVREHYERILDLLPELRDQPEPAWRDIPKPTGPEGWSFPDRGRSEPTAPRLAVVRDEPAPAEALGLEELGAAYARALADRARSRAALAEARVALDAAERSLAESEAEVERAHVRLVRATEGES